LGRESPLPTLQQTIADKFLEKLAAADEVDTVKIEQLRALLIANKKPKPDDFIKIFTLPAGGDLM
jgi:hypothetical protein